MSQIADFFWHPFSSAALKLLPKRGAGLRARSKRADRIPDDPQRPLLTDYHSINDPTIRVRVPKKVPTPVKVEAKVWFANERTFISYLSMGLLLSTIASGLLFGARDSPARWFAFAYALIFGEFIRNKDVADYADLLWGPMLICLALFVAILANFIFRFQEARKELGVNPLSLQNAWYEAGVKSSWM
ncbi:uncharacterized protein I303_105959 [Kwoniella dejecticola CBS 10117]|uniref:DUF202 domain-containing protein n=1 Tax=Kwoniella dejecticola CBS 10117 TaxID=1296121 RepID=A0AAJ8KS83_9TREE